MVIVKTYFNINEQLCFEIYGSMSALDIYIYIIYYFCVFFAGGGGQGWQLIHISWSDWKFDLIQCLVFEINLAFDKQRLWLTEILKVLQVLWVVLLELEKIQKKC